MVRSARSDTLRIEAPDPGQRAALDALILRSKAHWGYDAAMMDVMALWLKTDPAAFAEDRIRVARPEDGCAGVAQISAVREGACELELLFIDPGFMGTGAGKMLYRWAVSAAQERGARRLDILSDPGARGFYEAMGARFAGGQKSKAVPGRVLPRLTHSI